MTRDERSTQVKERITDSARRLFFERGYDGTSVRDIAAASGTNVAMVNYYFHSKSELFGIVFREALGILVSRIVEALTSGRGGAELIETWIETYYDLLAEFPLIPNFIFTAASHTPGSMDMLAPGFDPAEILQKLSEIIAAETACGTLRDYPAPHVVLNIVSLCVFPFVIGPLVSNVGGIDPAEYRTFLEEHKKHVINFVKNALVS